jgi:hypothetical protein
MNLRNRITIFYTITILTASQALVQHSSKDLGLPNENLFLNYLFQNSTNNNYIEKLNEFHVKLVKSSNKCLLKSKENEIQNLIKFHSNKTLWSNYLLSCNQSDDTHDNLMHQLTKNVSFYKKPNQSRP